MTGPKKKLQPELFEDGEGPSPQRHGEGSKRNYITRIYGVEWYALSNEELRRIWMLLDKMKAEREANNQHWDAEESPSRDLSCVGHRPNGY